MTITAKLRYLRIAPRKVRLVADLIRGKSVEEAQTVLSFIVKKAAEPLQKLVNSAVANAKHSLPDDSSQELDLANLYIRKITVDEGPKYKRWRPRARGQAYEIQKKTSHITIVLEGVEKRSKKKKRIKEAKKTEKVKQDEVKKEAPRQEKSIPVKPRPTEEMLRPKLERGIKRIFRRKAF